MFNKNPKILYGGVVELAERMFPGVQLALYAGRALKEAGKEDKPQAKISSLLTLLTCLGTVLYRELPIESVFLTMIGLLPDGPRLLESEVAHKKSIQAARARLGYAALSSLFESLTKEIPVRFDDFCGLIPIAMDGSVWSIYDSDKNAVEWNRPQSQYGDGSYPQFRMMSLVTTFDLAIRALRLYPVNTDEHRAALDMIDCLTDRHLLLLDRGIPSTALMSALIDRGIPFVARLPVNRAVSKLIRQYGEGDSLVVLTGENGKQIEVRLIEFTVKQEVVRLATTLSTHQAAKEEFFHLYHLRWLIETTLNLLKNALMGARHGRQDLSLRSQRPDLLVQEFYAMAIVYNLIRNQGRTAVERIGKAPWDYSFSNWRDTTKLSIERNLHPKVRASLLSSNQHQLPQRKRQKSGQTRIYEREVRRPPGHKKYRSTCKRHLQSWALFEPQYATTDRTLRAWHAPPIMSTPMAYNKTQGVLKSDRCEPSLLSA